MKRIVLIAAALFLIAGTALAAPVVDFASSSFSSIHNQPSATVNYGGVGYKFTAYPTGSKLTWNPGDGVGINDDEITGALLDRNDELLQIGFSKPLYVTGDLYHGSLQGIRIPGRGALQAAVCRGWLERLDFLPGRAGKPKRRALHRARPGKSPRHEVHDP